jgi:hypothetical protein
MTGARRAAKPSSVMAKILRDIVTKREITFDHRPKRGIVFERPRQLHSAPGET